MALDNGLLEELKQKTQLLNEKDAELRKSERMMRTVLEASPVGICLVEHRTIVWGNTALAETLDYQEIELAGLPLEALYESKEEYDRVGIEVYQKHLGGRRVGDIRARMRRRSGKVIDALLKVSFVDCNKGKETMVIAVVLDLVELRNYCDDLLAETTA
jgi:PAS domain S-box-containing protein